MAIWNEQNKRRPGTYINFVSDDVVRLGGEEGRITMLLEANWGPQDTFVEVDSTTRFERLFGAKINEFNELFPIREALKACSTVLVYLPAKQGGAKASYTSTGFTATANYEGTVGNNITLIINATPSGGAVVTTALNGQAVDQQVVASGALPNNNDYVNFEGTLPADDVTANLTGGVTGTVNQEVYATYLDKLANQEFTHIALPTTDETIKRMAMTKVKEFRDNGKPVWLVTNNFNADYEGVISVANGVVLDDMEVPAEGVVYWLAGAQAAAGAGSLTFAPYPGASRALDVVNVLDLLEQGQIVLTNKNGLPVIEQDINTLITFTPDKGQDFAKNKILRVMGIIERQVSELFETQFIGRIPNNENGRQLFKSAIVTDILDPLMSQGAIEFIADDIEILSGESKEGVVVNADIYFSDAMEKLYMTVKCQ